MARMSEIGQGWYADMDVSPTGAEVLPANIYKLMPTR